MTDFMSDPSKMKVNMSKDADGEKPRMVKLGELIAPVKSARAGDMECPLLSMTMHNGLIDQSLKFNKRVASQDTSAYKLIDRNQLVVGFPIDEAVLDFQTLYDRAMVSPAYGVWELRDPYGIDREYLRRFLRSDKAIAYYKAKLQGSTARRRSLPNATFCALPVPLPSLEEQRRIVAVLDRADAIRAKRRQMLADLDELPRSLFSEMFGDRVWSRVPLGKIVADLQGGKNLVANDAAAESVNRVLKISAITSGVFRSEESKPLPDDYLPPLEHFVRDGDLLISRANTAELVGAVALVRGAYTHLVLPDKIWRFVWRDMDAQNQTYILWMMRTPGIRRAIVALASGTSGSMKNISKSKFLKMLIPLPPIELQKEFARRVEAIAAARAKVERALALDDELFAALQSRAFRDAL